MELYTMNKLTNKQKRFVDAFVNNGGNGREAIMAAGYNCNNDNSARVLASENLKKPNVVLAIRQSGYIDSRIINTEAIEGAREIDFANRRISTREDRAEFLKGFIWTIRFLSIPDCRQFNYWERCTVIIWIEWFFKKRRLKCL